MAQKVTVALEDDLDGGPAAETIRFAFGGTDYEIDFLLRKLAEVAKAGRGQPRRPGRTAASRQHSGEVRAWAKEHGIAVSDRGRIPAGVVEQYNAAVGTGR